MASLKRSKGQGMMVLFNSYQVPSADAVVSVPGPCGTTRWSRATGVSPRQCHSGTKRVCVSIGGTEWTGRFSFWGWGCLAALPSLIPVHTTHCRSVDLNRELRSSSLHLFTNPLAPTRPFSLLPAQGSRCSPTPVLSHGHAT